ncbi:MAG: putative lipid II flippase FtsW, partial [Clostridia bacterium]|nr:putative lipid II flippase FtsW [Clostridia bacterium]
MKTNSREKLLSKQKTKAPDLCVIILVLALVGFGCVMVLSASSYSAELSYGSSTFFLKKQILGVLMGLVGGAIMTFFPYQKLKKMKWVLLAVSALLLLCVFLPGIGVENYGARRWLNLGVTTIQPSEIAKIAFIVFAASWLSEKTTKVKNFKDILPVLAVGGMFCVLIIMEPNMSITMCMGLLMVAMLFVGGASFKHFMWLMIPALLLVPALIIMEPYRMKRLVAFLDPWASAKGEGFQLVQSLYSIASGGWFGVGIGNSRQKYLFLPFAESDFIFSIIAEETGFVGCFVLLCVFVALIVRILAIGKRAKDRFGCYLCSGIACLIAIQVLLNVAVVTGSIPPTGLPLPFISAG